MTIINLEGKQMTLTKNQKRALSVAKNIAFLAAYAGYFSGYVFLVSLITT